MLSWSSIESGAPVDLSAVAQGSDGSGVEHGSALLRFATACGERDEEALIAARAALVETTDEAFMVDTAAVAANFEMMTRLADATGARMTGDVLEARAAQIGVMGIGELTSRR